MQAWLITRYGTPREAMALREVAKPTAGPGELVVRVQAASINPLDIKLAAGALKYVQKMVFPAASGLDLAGEVEEIGADTHGFAIGDAVYARAHRLRRGAFAEYVAIPADLVAPAPRTRTVQEAAALPLVSLTVIQGLTDRAHLKADQRVLILAGSGGVGTIAIQYAKALGAHVTTTTSSRNVDLVKELGADEVIAYDRESIHDRRQTYDVVFDALGGDETVRAFQLVKPGGCVVSIAGPPDAELPKVVNANWLVTTVMGLMRRKVDKAARARGATYYRFLTESSGAQLRDLTRLVDEGAVRPIIDHVYPFEKAIEAFERVNTGRARGKVVLVWS